MSKYCIITDTEDVIFLLQNIYVGVFFWLKMIRFDFLMHIFLYIPYPKFRLHSQRITWKGCGMLLTY